MTLLRSWWFRGIAISLVAIMVAVTLVGLSFRVSVKSERGFVSIGISTVYAQEPAIGEVIEGRTQSSKIYYLGNSRYSIDTKIGSVHYKDTVGDWQNIDNSWLPAVSPWDWYMEKDGYHTYVLEDFTAGQVLKFESQGSQVAFQPMALEWTNDLNQIQSISMPQNVPVSITNEPVELLPGMFGSVGKIKWENGYGAGRHFEWANTPGRLSKLLQLDTPPPAPPQFIIDGGNPVLRLNFIFDPTSDLDIIVGGQTWDKSSRKQTVGRIEFWKKGSIVWVFNPLRYWDSSEDNSGIGTTVLSKSGNKLYVSALVPYSWLKMATYPVFIDPTVELFPNHFRYFHTEAWNGDKKWIEDTVDGVSPASSSTSPLNSTGNFLIQGFQSEPVNETTLSAGHWGFYLWGNHDGSSLKASLFVEVRKNNSTGQLLATSGYTLNLTTSETEYHTYLDFPETAWNSGDTVWVGIYANVTVKQNGKRAYFYYDHTSRESRALNPTIDVQVGVTTDDGFTSGSLSNTAIWVGLWGSSENAWYRWTGITISVGATIGANTYVSLDAMGSGGTITNVHTRLYFNDVSAPVVPSSIADYNAKVITTNFMDFDPSAWVVNTWYNIDASAIIAELVASYDYSGGGAMMALHKNDGSSANSDIRAYDYSNDTTKAPKLHIEYTAGGVPDISVSPTSYNFGVVQPGSSTNTTTTYFTITNSSTIQTDQTISVTTTSWSGGNGWSHNDSGTPGDNATAILANRGGTWGTGDVIVKNAAPNYIYENCPASTNYSFGLGLWTPLTMYDGAQKTITVRVSAVAG